MNNIMEIFRKHSKVHEGYSLSVAIIGSEGGMVLEDIYRGSSGFRVGKLAYF